MPSPADDVIVAQLAPSRAGDRPPAPPATNNRPLLLLGCGFAVLLAGCLATFVGGIVMLARQQRVPPGPAIESLAEKQALLRRGFDPDATISHPDQKNIERFLQRIVTASRRGNDVEFHKLVDFDELNARARRHPTMPSLSYLERFQLSNGLKTEPRLDAVSQCRLAGIHEVDANHVQVFAWLGTSYDPDEAWRLWLVKRDDQWLLADWELVDYGYSVSDRFAVYLAAGKHANWIQHLQAEAHMERAGKFVEQDKTTEARRQLQQAESQKCPPVIADLDRYQLLMQWLRVNDRRKILSVCEGSDSAAKSPGFQRQLAIALESLGKYEEALQATERYEQVAGFQPAVVELRARLLKELNRPGDALDLYLKLHRFAAQAEPVPPPPAAYFTGREHLSAIYALLPDERKMELLDLVKQSKNPVETAVNCVPWLLQSDDHELVEQLEKLVVDLSPRASERFTMEAQRLANDWEHEGAADRYRQAAEAAKDEAQKAQHWQSYLWEMQNAGKTSEALKVHPTPGVAFRELVSAYEEGESLLKRDEFSKLIAECLAADPRNVDANYAAALLALEDRDSPAAEKHLVLVAASTDEEARYMKDSAVRLRLQNALERGDGVAAFQASEDKEAALETLGNTAVQQHRWQDLQQLVDAYRGQPGSDASVWLLYFDAKLALRAKDIAAAERFIADGKSKANASTHSREKAFLESAEFDLLVKAYGVVGAYERHPDGPEVFSRLHRTAIERRDWGAAGRLCDLQQRRRPDDGELLAAQVLTTAQQGDDQQVVTLLEPWPGADKFQNPWEESQARSTLIRSLIRLGRADDAVRFIREHDPRNIDALALSLLAAGDVHATEELIARQNPPDLHLASRLAASFPQGTRKLLRDPKLAEFWRAHPPAIHSPFGSGLVILSSADEAWNPESIRAALRKIVPELIMSDSQIHPGGTTYQIVWPGAETAGVQLTLGNTPYVSEQQLRADGVVHAEVRQAFQQHRRWLALEMFDPSPVAEVEAKWQQLRQMMAELLAEDTLALGSRDVSEYSHRFVVARPDLSSVLRQTQHLATLLEDQPADWVSRGESEQPARDVQRRWKQLTRQWGKAETKPTARIRMTIHHGHWRESAWFRVVEIRKGEFGARHAIAEPVSTTPLVMRVLPVGRCLISSHSIEDLVVEQGD